MRGLPAAVALAVGEDHCSGLTLGAHSSLLGPQPPFPSHAALPEAWEPVQTTAQPLETDRFYLSS